MKWIFTLEKDGSHFTVKQQEDIKRVIEDYDFANFNSLKSIELVDINNNSFTVEVKATDNTWQSSLSQLLQGRADLFKHKEAGKQLFNTECI